MTPLSIFGIISILFIIFMKIINKVQGEYDTHRDLFHAINFLVWILVGIVWIFLI